MRPLLFLALLLADSTAVAATLDVAVLDSKGKPVEGALVLVLEAKGRFKAPKKPAVMDQVGKKFVPHVLPVLVGTKVEFPNQDEIHHHVYSFSKTKRIDLPLYKGKPADPVVMDSTGVVKLGCNIHDWMQGHLVVLPNPYFALTGADGVAKLTGLPAGAHRVGVWSSRRKQPVEEAAQGVTLGKKDAKTLSFKLSFGPPHEQKAPAGVGGRY